MIPAPAIFIVLIFSPKIRYDNVTMRNMDVPENIGYAMLKLMFLNALVKNKTLMPPRIKPNVNIMSQKKLVSLLEMLL